MVDTFIRVKENYRVIRKRKIPAQPYRLLPITISPNGPLLIRISNEIPLHLHYKPTISK